MNFQKKQQHNSKGSLVSNQISPSFLSARCPLKLNYNSEWSWIWTKHGTHARVTVLLNCMIHWRHIFLSALKGCALILALDWVSAWSTTGRKKWKEKGWITLIATEVWLVLLQQEPIKLTKFINNLRIQFITQIYVLFPFWWPSRIWRC